MNRLYTVTGYVLIALGCALWVNTVYYRYPLSVPLLVAVATPIVIAWMLWRPSRLRLWWKAKKARRVVR